MAKSKGKVKAGKSVDDKFWDKGYAKSKQEFDGSAAKGKTLPGQEDSSVKSKQEFGGK